MVSKGKNVNRHGRKGRSLVPNKIKEWRMHRGFTSQRALAKASGIPAPTINRLELQNLAYSPNTLSKLAKALRCHEGDLISRSPEDIIASAFIIYERMSKAKQTDIRRVAESFTNPEE